MNTLNMVFKGFVAFSAVAMFALPASAQVVDFNIFGTPTTFTQQGGGSLDPDYKYLNSNNCDIDYFMSYYTYYQASRGDRLWGWGGNLTAPVYKGPEFAAMSWSHGGNLFGVGSGNNSQYPGWTDTAHLPRKKIVLPLLATKLKITMSFARQLTKPTLNGVAATASGYFADAYCGITEVYKLNNGNYSFGYGSRPYSVTGSGNGYNAIGKPSGDNNSWTKFSEQGIINYLGAPRIILMENSNYNKDDWSYVQPLIGGFQFHDYLDNNMNGAVGLEPGGSTLFSQRDDGVLLGKSSVYGAPYKSLSMSVTVPIPSAMRGKTVYMVLVPFFVVSRISTYTSGQNTAACKIKSTGHYYLRTSGTVTLDSDAPRDLKGTLTLDDVSLQGFTGTIKSSFKVSEGP